MKIIRLISLLAAIYLVTATAQVSAMTLDTIDATSLQPLTYFIPSPGQESDDPYYRYRDMDLSTDGVQSGDWGWAHNAIGGGITSATLSITAFDVDNPNILGMPNQIDEIEAYDNLSNTWKPIGVLLGTDIAFSDTVFDLDMEWFADIALGLEVRILIDQLDTDFWGVSLKKSVLSIVHTPNPVPLPAAAWLFGTAILGLAGFGRRKQKV